MDPIIATGKVLFSYDAQDDNQITVKEGQIVPLFAIGVPGGWSRSQEEGTGTY